MNDSQKFRSVISTILQIPEDQINDDLTAEKIDTWDSLNHINLIGALEQEFGLTLTTEILEQSQSISQLKTMLVEHGIEV